VTEGALVTGDAVCRGGCISRQRAVVARGAVTRGRRQPLDLTIHAWGARGGLVGALRTEGSGLTLSSIQSWCGRCRTAIAIPP